MVRFSNFKSKLNLFFFWSFLLSKSFLLAQQTNTSQAIENIYLHTDRSIYFLGEDLWYKAYDVNTNTNALYDNSNILYVELIAPDSKIIARNKTNLELGLGNGDFRLSDSLGVKPGKYQLRAYTNWNRNFGDDFVFKKNIEVIDVFNAKSKSQSNAKGGAGVAVSSNSTIKNENNVLIDFFPEGGSFLENVASVVGFKAVDANSESIEVSGEIFDSDNQLITVFSTVHDGMGKFQLIPIENKTYYAKVKTKQGKIFQKELPRVLKNGYLLSYIKQRGRNIISIATNASTLAQNPSGKVSVICKYKGNTYLETVQALTENTVAFEIPKTKTPEGISQITLYDANLRPQSERLVYFEKDSDIDVQIGLDKLIYKPNEKVIVNVSCKTKAGEAKAASFSMSVTDRNGVGDETNYDSTICSYYLVESDIRGKVHHPGYYFDTNNPKRLEYLDNLLLTQGWRDFLWKTQPKSSESIYPIEKGITISGRVKQLLGEKVLVNANVTLALKNKSHFNFFSTLTDIDGNFKFENLMFSGKTSVFLNSANEKGKSRGQIIINPFESDVPMVDFKSTSIDFSPKEEQLLIDNVLKKFTALGVRPENILEEVAVKSNVKKKSTGIIGIPDFTYTSDNDTASYTDIYQLIEQKVPNTILDTETNSVRFTRYQSPPLFIVDGFEVVDLFQVSSILPSKVVKIDAIRGNTASLYYGAAAENGVIAIATNQLNVQNRKKEVFHSVQSQIDGFYTPRVFYSPNPETQQENKIAARNTIYWNPYVHPDKTGTKEVSYYNSNVDTKVKIGLEGITSSGIPLIKSIYYTVKK